VTGTVTDAPGGIDAPLPGEALLEVEDLRVEFGSDDGAVKAVDGVSFTVAPGETVAIVGESGSGKSVTALSVMGLITKPGRIAGGDIRYAGRSLLTMREDDYRRLRGGDLAMIFQDPLSSMNPAFRVGDQIGEAIRTHHPEVDKKAARARAAELLASVGIPQAAERVRDYPHQFSGGMRQRAMIAMAIANAPKLLIADEPTTALDVTIQAQVLDVLRRAQADTDAAMVLITHDLGIVAGMADRVLVMYAGRVVEEGTLDEIFYASRHPYTRGLLAALPRLDTDRGEPLRTIAGTPPSLVNLPPGCSLNPRCLYRQPHCVEEAPELVEVPGEPGHRVACFRSAEVPQLAAELAEES
jgi:oligopeptide/dipeptide ABC transporter ATP-binding protein